MIAVIVVNYGRPKDTIECLASLVVESSNGLHVFVFDNGVNTDSGTSILQRHVEGKSWISYHQHPQNLGFAGACDRMIELVLSQGRFDAVALLNNDAIASPGWLSEMARHLDRDRRVAMVAARMVRFDQLEEIDSLGIALYRSGIAANRKSLDEPLLGPCGGAALYGIELLREVKKISGHIFDPDFFCYAEDTDLAIRANLLGYRAAYAHDAVVRHKGSLTSGGGNSDFVMYHGLRNSLHCMQRDLPLGFLMRYWPWMLLAQAGVVAKYLRLGRLPLLWSVYRDWIRSSAKNRKFRKRLREAGVLRWAHLATVVSPRLYERSHLSQQLRLLLRPTPRDE